MTKLYLAGPMTGIPQFNYPAFEEAAAALRSVGVEVQSPAEMDNDEDREAAMASTDGSAETYTGTSTWGDFLARDVKLLADDGIDAVVVLPGWEGSRGARLETYVAMLCAKPIVTMHKIGEDVSLYRVPDLLLIRAWAGTPAIDFVKADEEAPSE